MKPNRPAIGLAVGFALTAWVFLFGAVTEGRCEARGTVYKKVGSMTGTIVYKKVAKKYLVTDPKTAVTMEVPASEVVRVDVKDPPELEPACKLVQGGQGAAAIANLEKIVREWEGLGPDARAARWLAEAYQKTGNAPKAVEMCRKVIEGNANVPADLQAVYWQSLLDANMVPQLKKALVAAVGAGNRQTAGAALIKTGDIARKEANPQNALVDGYLRVVVLFQDIKEIQPEALYKTVKCFEDLKQPLFAERMRKKLLEEYPEDEYSQKLQSGG